MRIAIVHSVYNLMVPSGENDMVIQQLAGLGNEGHEVRLFSIGSESSTPIRKKIKLALRVTLGCGSKLSREINDYKPDIVHIHNTFPNIGVKELLRILAPKVHTVHNFRAICANAVLTRNGTECTRCVGGSKLNSILYRCYKKSFLATLPIFIAQKNKNLSIPINYADSVIYLSERSRQIYEKAGWDTSNWNYIPNGSHKFTKANKIVKEKFVIVGRLSAEKNLDQLLKSWPMEFTLQIIGDGPNFQDLSNRYACEKIYFSGKVPKDEIQGMISENQALIFLSNSPEGGFPVVAIDAISSGTPIISFGKNSCSDAVEKYQLGVTFEIADQDTLRAACNVIISEREKYANQAQLVFEEFFSEKIWLTKLVDLYNKTLIKVGKG